MSITSLASAMFEVGHPLKAALIGVVLGFQAAACADGDVVLGERGGHAAGADSGTREGGAGSAGAAASAGTGGSAGAEAAGAGGAGGSAPLRPSAGCGIDPLAPDHRIEVNGLSAGYVLDLPAAYDKTRAYPLVMAFRRSDTTAAAFRDSLGLPVAVGDDAILVHPDCLDGASTWDIPRDLPLIEALLSKLASSYCIDEDRVFGVGLGQGALLVNAFACLRSDTWRAFAPLSAVLAPAPGVCVGDAAVWLMQGSAEPSTMTYGRDNRDFWIERNGCDASAPMAVAPSPCVAYSGCDPGLPVRFCEYGADLPSFTARAIWDFFREF